MARKILNTLTFGLSGAIIGDGKKKKTTPVPEPAPAAMPVADDEAVRRARRSAIIRNMGRRGRSSTMLTPDSETLGG